ncbi:YaaC-like Protein [Alteribacillus persepolensis]|uniref:YaaC-like Protein n=1 Tax=Alteribacillus persepolensis TaxID=568899 RepID=A0A1G8IY99_9BACI|nr:YaaC family protein [Alteribacillus persepolensis]SDI23772.1 YaaC-like Protein [Alteribacillus persepolensis]
MNALHSNHDLFAYYAPFESQEVLRQLLYERYQKTTSLQEKASEYSYQNTPVFHYEWMIGRNYWMEGLNASLLIKPLLLFYGLTHLLKGIILLTDPMYPASAEVLAHGVTSRKRKKKGYTFLEDEVKVQKKGFFPHFAYYLFHMEHLPHTKWKMADLLIFAKDMASLYFDVKGTSHCMRVEQKHASIKLYGKQTIHQDMLSTLQNALYAYNLPVKDIVHLESQSVTFTVDQDKANKKPLLLTYHNKHYLPPSFPKKLHQLPDMCLHFLLLYNLSMICRYEGEWWGEVMTQQYSEDYPIIKHYLAVAERSVPALFATFFHK